MPLLFAMNRNNIPFFLYPDLIFDIYTKDLQNYFLYNTKWLNKELVDIKLDFISFLDERSSI
ncbi:MAG TPA: hypothetical protein VHJ38_07495 [Nitrososphaeraceae archaeon]|nr:hypothetical protein [Nitrososphaeraceae archaeon]